MELQAKELMAGDVVKLSIALLKDLCQPYVSRLNIKNIAAIDNGQLVAYPIPLTEDILKANGFEDKADCARYNSVFYCLFIGNVSISFEVDNGLPILTIEDTADASSQHNVICLKDEIYNVHELQHALKLCGLTDLADNFQV